jgi:hypothetical protein
MEATPDLVAKYHLHEHGQVAGPQAGLQGGAVIPATSSTRTNRSSQTLHDALGLVLTEDDVFQTWSYNGSTITNVGSGHTGTSYASDGWNVTGSYFNVAYNTPTYLQSNGGASFRFVFGSFAHSQSQWDEEFPDGHCSAAFYNSGTGGVPGGYYTYAETC